VATDNDFEFPSLIQLDKFTQQWSCLNTRSEWYLAESDIDGRNVARKIFGGGHFSNFKASVIDRALK